MPYLSKVGFMSDTSSSPWRTAYVAAIFETDNARMVLKVADARAAITERLNNPIEISKLEYEAIEAARQALGTLKAERVDAVWSAPT
jgi:1,6-anhydro-N-acetylmuramate kinase